MISEDDDGPTCGRPGRDHADLHTTVDQRQAQVTRTDTIIAGCRADARDTVETVVHAGCPECDAHGECRGISGQRARRSAERDPWQAQVTSLTPSLDIAHDGNIRASQERGTLTDHLRVNAQGIARVQAQAAAREQDHDARRGA